MRFHAFERQRRRLRFVLYLDERGGVFGWLQRLGYRNSDRLSIPMDGGILHDRKIAQREAFPQIVSPARKRN